MIVLTLICITGHCQTNNNATKDTDITNNIKLKFTSSIYSTFEDSMGNLWFGSHNQGVSMYDGNSFIYFTTKDGLSGNQVRSIQEDQLGNIWFGTQKGVSNYDGKIMTNHNQFLSQSNTGFSTNNWTPSISPIESKQNQWSKTPNDLWFNAGNKTGVYRYNGLNLDYLEFPETKPKTHNNVYQTTGIAKGQNNWLWIATFAAVIGYDGNNFKIINDQSLNLTPKTGQLHVRSIFEDSKGNLWVGNNSIGVLLIKDNKTINFSEKMGLIADNSQRSGSKSPANTLEHVFSITEDDKNNIWFADRDSGVWKYDGQTMTNYSGGNGLPTKKFIRVIYQSKSNGLLFGSLDGGVYIFNGKYFERKF